MSRQTEIMNAVRHFVFHVIYFSFENVLLFLFALVMIFTVNMKLAICMLVVLPFTAFITYRQSKEIKPAFRQFVSAFPASMLLHRRISVVTVL